MGKNIWVNIGECGCSGSVNYVDVVGEVYGCTGRMWVGKVCGCRVGG